MEVIGETNQDRMCRAFLSHTAHDAVCGDKSLVLVLITVLLLVN